MEKYLVYDKDLKKFLTVGDALVCYDMLENGVVDFMYGEYMGLEPLEESDYAFFQSTTATDCNGNEIYEGHIIEFEDVMFMPQEKRNFEMELVSNRAVVRICPIYGIYLENHMIDGSDTETMFDEMDKVGFLNDSKIVGHIKTDIGLLEG